MKTFIITLVILSAGFAVQAQELAPDQNPNYKVSSEKYKTMANGQTAMNTTVQDTYKAYDWSTAKAERKTERRNERRERRLYNNYDNRYNPYDYNNNYYNRPYRYNHYRGW